MKRSRGMSWVLVCAVALLPLAGCNDDDDLTDIPVVEAVEAGLNQAMTTTVVPLVVFMGTVGDLLTAPIIRSARGQACPFDTSGWCTTGTAVCSVGQNGYDVVFNECAVVTGDAPMTLDGNVTAVPGSPIVLTLTNLVINGHPALSGIGTIDVNACTYGINVHNADTTVSGTVEQCDDDDYPTGDIVGIGFDDFVVTVTLDGDNTAGAIATQGATPVAECTINLDTFASNCSEL